MIIATDLEGTLTLGATWKGLRSYMRAQGDRRVDVYAYTRLPKALLARAGIVNIQKFKQVWLTDILGFFAGMTPEEFQSVAEFVAYEEMWPHRRRDVLDELHRHRDAGARVILTTGTFAPIAEAFAARAGLAEVVSTPLEVVDGRLTGREGKPYNTGQAKAGNLRAYLNGAAPDRAYGDTLADVPMLESSGEAVAVYPDKQLAKVAAMRGWRVLGQAR